MLINFLIKSTIFTLPVIVYAHRSSNFWGDGEGRGEAVLTAMTTKLIKV